MKQSKLEVSRNDVVKTGNNEQQDADGRVRKDRKKEEGTEKGAEGVGDELKDMVFMVATGMEVSPDVRLGKEMQKRTHQLVRQGNWLQK